MVKWALIKQEKGMHIFTKLAKIRKSWSQSFEWCTILGVAGGSVIGTLVLGDHFMTHIFNMWEDL